MSKKKVSFVQVNYQTGPQELNNHYLPYSAGIILAYAFADPVIQQQWQIEHIIWRRDLIETTAQMLAESDVVAFSTYVWNHRYNYALAQRIKEINPGTQIVFGGPEPAVTDPDIFVKEPFMDVIIKMEGEKTFKALLENHGKDLDTIPGLLINQSGRPIDTGDSARIDNLGELPSPYLSGIFDGIIRDNPTVTWSATLETNRGCPFQCTFCDWGSLTYNKVKKFELDRVFAEIEWMGKHCGYIHITDANFGAFVERDNLIIGKLLEVQRKYGRVANFTMTWAKNQKNEVVDMVKRLIDETSGTGRGLTVSTQSMDLQVLENIKRRNLDQHKLQEIFTLCDRKGVPVYTEVILGLPGETPQSWQEGIYRILRAGNHYGINILQAQMLENAEMNLGQRRLYRIESRPVYDYIYTDRGYNEESGLDESIDIVVSTSTIDAEQMLDLATWNSFIQCFHFNGLTTWLSRFIAKYQGIDYQEFYARLYQRLKQDAWFVEQLQTTRDYYQNWFTQGHAGHPPIQGVKMAGWNLVYRLTLMIQIQRRIPQVFELIDDFMRTFSLPADMHQQLMRFQQNNVMDYEGLKSLPLFQQSAYDFYSYLVHDTPLHQTCEYEFWTKENVDMSMQAFLEGYHFGRTRNFGKTRIKLISASGLMDRAMPHEHALAPTINAVPA